LLVGAIQFLLGIFSLGFIVNFLSRPVITGFTSAVALTIGLNQFRNLLGVDFLQSDLIQVVAVDIVKRIGDINLQTASIGLVSVLVIIILKRINKKIPNALIVVVFGIILLKYFGVHFDRVAIVKDIPSGLPGFSMPTYDLDQIRELMPIALTLVMVGYLETISIGKSLEAQQDEYRIRPNQELIALGLSNMVGSLFKSYPIASSFSRSAINQETGGKTGVSAFVSVIMVALTLLYLTPLFYYLPKTVLAAIIIVAVFGLINFKEAKYLWKANNLDFWLLIATFASTLVLGIEYGIFVGVALSLIILLFRTTRPYVTELGKVPDSDFFRNKNRFEEVIIEKDILVFRFDAQLFYANAGYFRDKLDEMVEAKGDGLKIIVFDAESMNRVDSTAVEMLKERIIFYQKKAITFYFAAVKGPVRDSLFKSGILEIIDINHFFMRPNDAVVYYKTGNRDSQIKYAQYIHQAYE
ncbi:MAG: SulP family inorganic anion transporter, partial [Polaribacter sp.]